MAGKSQRLLEYEDTSRSYKIGSLKIKQFQPRSYLDLLMAFTCTLTHKDHVQSSL